MTVFAFNVILIVAITALAFKYLRLREITSGEHLPDLAYLGGLASLIDSAEGYASPHSIVMAQNAAEIGRRIGIAEPGILSIRLAALLHDCGQINLPRDIFKKNGPLTPEDWFLVKTHPLLGELALRRAVPILEEVPSLVRWHHERWDGSGYPDRLQGEEIPLAARILAVVDAASAMSQARPYRPARSDQQIQHELVRLSGLHFDPEIVNVRGKIASLQAANTGGRGN